jgi:hypothetical protein
MLENYGCLDIQNGSIKLNLDSLHCVFEIVSGGWCESYSGGDYVLTESVIGCLREDAWSTIFRTLRNVSNVFGPHALAFYRDFFPYFR